MKCHIDLIHLVFLGYAIIQLPDCLLFLHKYVWEILLRKDSIIIRKIRSTRNISTPEELMDDKSKVRKVNVATTTLHPPTAPFSPYCCILVATATK